VIIYSNVLDGCEDSSLAAIFTYRPKQSFERRCHHIRAGWTKVAGLSDDDSSDAKLRKSGGVCSCVIHPVYDKMPLQRFDEKTKPNPNSSIEDHNDGETG
jgi:hypothetical protein